MAREPYLDARMAAAVIQEDPVHLLPHLFEGLLKPLVHEARRRKQVRDTRQVPQRWARIVRGGTVVVLRHQGDVRVIQAILGVVNLSAAERKDRELIARSKHGL